MIIIVFIFFLLAWIDYRLDPYLDVTDTHIILWYNQKYRRAYKILWKKNF